MYNLGQLNKFYEECLLILQLTTLETRRKRGDLSEGFKILKRFDNVDSCLVNTFYRLDFYIRYNGGF